MELNKIYCEDCLETMSRMEHGFIDLIITSPMYNFDKSSGLGDKYNGSVNDNKSTGDYYDWSVRRIDEMLRVSKLVAYNIQMLSGNKEALFNLMGNYSKQIKEILIWDKMSAEPAIEPNVFNSEFEFIFLMSNSGGGRKIKQATFDRGKQSNVLRVGKHTGISNKHCACYPERLPATLINNLSKEGDIIYDPFIGLGTTAISAIKYKRNWIGSEISQEYVDLANKRLEPYLSQQVLF